MALPKHTDELCFDTDAFLDEDFTVDDFVNKCRKRVTIECLRDDLDAYYRTLKSAMVELINKDYADFVNLSSNLVGVDKAIDGLATPLEQLREEVMSIKAAMDEAISAIESKLSARMDIRTKKATLKRLIVVMESLESLERLLKIHRRSSPEEELSEIEQLAEREEFAAVVMERVASEFNQLQYNVSLTRDHPLVAEITPRIAAVTSSLQARLEHSFQVALDKGDRDGLTHCLQAYASISRQEDAESMFQSMVVHPYLEKVISTKAVLSGSGLAGMYTEILNLLPKHCSLLLELTHPQPSGLAPRVPGFDFVTNAVWPEVVALIDERVSVIFAPGNPDNFYKNYTTTMGFVASFEAQCPTKTSVKKLRAHPYFTAFLSKWSLPVYFQIRFQEIAGVLENSLCLAQAQESPQSAPAFKLELFRVLWSCLHRCWSEGVFISALVHWFWKLTLQLIIRVMNWLNELSRPEQAQSGPEKTAVTSGQDQASLTVSQNLHVIHDCELFGQQVPKFFTEVLSPKLPLKALKDPGLLQGSMEEASKQINKLIPQFSSCIISQVSQNCIQNLEPAHTIPRLYRRTNREAPQKVSSYVVNILKPLRALQGEIPVKFEQQWRADIIQRVTERYYEITSEVLTSVKRTEDSLLKLRRKRQSLVPLGGMSDDNKIRLQLALDIEEYSSQVQKFNLTAFDRDLPSLAQLLEMGRAAKTLALTAPTEQS